MYSELESINKLIFKPLGIVLTNVAAELESKEYFAHKFQINGQHVIFRCAKITPTKIGQFVTIWKRDDNGITQPFDLHDDFNFCIITARKNENFGLFIFPKLVLYHNKILSDNTRDGKRGIRVYPTWDLTANKQAQKTQLWQTEYFIALSKNEEIDFETVKKLLTMEN